ncbi:fructosamine kinase family protein [Anaerophaga thermohalophila]|uniref:fructosamine kinase family protein n=1 Tax=Anaerophaga thermohalophila TaxID=177400 RepID=UPI00031AEA4D|nr:fructosamine kinase family protein [Anaerophaga thermohalophila]
MNKQQLEQLLGEDLTGMSSVGGGCIADSQVITTRSGRKFFLKQGFSNGMFRKEANGLKELARPGVIKVPDVIDCGDDYLILEHIEQGSKKKDFFEDLGHKLALLHRFEGEHFGFFEDNFIGSTPQENIPSEDEAHNWPLFYWNKRLMFQFRLAEKNGYADNTMQHLFALLEKVYEKILEGSEEAPSLMHGDLWGGNYMSDIKGNPVLIDPAVYYGHREADLAMTKLFGGFSAAFYRAYEETWPLQEGASERESIYLLYHVMNHLNLFGTGYYSQAIRLLEKLIR